MFYKIAHAVAGFLFRVFFRLRVTGRENVPPGGALCCANHTTLSDPVLAALALSSRDHPRFMAKMELFKIPVLKQLITALGAYPIERGKGDLQAVKATLSFLKRDEKILMFPQGGRVDAQDAMALKTGAAMLAARSGKPIVPIFIQPGRGLSFFRGEVVIGKPFGAEIKTGQGRAEAYADISARLIREIQSLGAKTRRAARRTPR